MLVVIEDSYDKMSADAASLIADRIRRKPNLVLGLATGSTPIGLYKELIRMHKNDGLDFSKVTTFNLDEYLGLEPSHEQSYHYFMDDNLFNHINICKRYVHVPEGLTPDVEGFCQWYEDEIEEAGGVDIQVLGIGANGHIAFNEPGSSLSSRTRAKKLTVKTRQDNARFFSSLEEVPTGAITMGIGTIMDSAEIIMLANKANKAEAVKKSVEGPISASCPASIIQLHEKAYVLVEKEAASLLEGAYDEKLEF